MKVLMTADAVGGVWTYALELADALAPHGVEVSLATMGAPLRPDQRAEAARAELGSLHESSFALEWMPDPWDDVERAGCWLLELAEELRPDVVHLNGYAHAALPWPAPVVAVAHSCVLSWFEAVRGEPAPPEWKRYAAEVRRGLAAADVLVAPTRAMLGAVLRLYEPPCDAFVVPNGRSPATIVAAKEPLVLAGGRLWDEAKNIAALDRVAPVLDWPIVVTGEAGGSPPRNLRLLGTVGADELARLRTRASIFALPARYEPFGLAALEAAQARCALVVGDIASLREVWGDAALFVPPDDDAALAAALRALIADARLREELAGRAAARARTFTPERMAAGYLDAYARAGARLEAAA